MKTTESEISVLARVRAERPEIAMARSTAGKRVETVHSAHDSVLGSPPT
jgi:hypothetical protein